jgi:hypothetical protein
MSIEIEKLKKHAKELINIGERRAGTPQIRSAAKYVAEELQSYGYETQIWDFPILTSTIIGAPTLYVNGEKIACKGVYFSGNAKNLEGEILYDNKIVTEKLEGKIILTDVSYSPPRPEKAQMAREKGALAIIYIHFGSSDSNIIGTGGIKYVWGNPNSESIKKIPRMPAVSISRHDGERLIEKILHEERLIGNINIKTNDSWVKANQPIAFKGNKESKCIVFGTPLEALGATAINNSASNAALLEIARNVIPNKYSIMVLFTDGVEIAESAGSTFLVDNCWPYLKEKARLYINVEGLGTEGAKRAVSYVSPSIREFVKAIEIKNGIYSEMHYEIRIADSSFTGIGIPYYCFTHVMNKSMMQKYHGANHGWWYRSEADTIEHVDFNLLLSESTAILKVYNEITKYKNIPYSIVPYLKESLESIKKIPLFKDKIINDKFITLKEKLDNTLRDTEKLEINLNKDNQEILEELMLNIIHETSNVFMTVAGKYDQDPYGFIWKDEILPGLMFWLEKYKKNPLLDMTAFMREINRTYDAIDKIAKMAHYGEIK